MKPQHDLHQILAIGEQCRRATAAARRALRGRIDSDRLLRILRQGADINAIWPHGTAPGTGTSAHLWQRLLDNKLHETAAAALGIYLQAPLSAQHLDVLSQVAGGHDAGLPLVREIHRRLPARRREPCLLLALHNAVRYRQHATFDFLIEHLKGSDALDNRLFFNACDTYTVRGLLAAGVTAWPAGQRDQDKGVLANIVVRTTRDTKHTTRSHVTNMLIPESESCRIVSTLLEGVDGKTCGRRDLDFALSGAFERGLYDLASELHARGAAWPTDRVPEWRTLPRFLAMGIGVDWKTSGWLWFKHWAGVVADSNPEAMRETLRLLQAAGLNLGDTEDPETGMNAIVVACALGNDKMAMALIDSGHALPDGYPVPFGEKTWRLALYNVRAIYDEEEDRADALAAAVKSSSFVAALSAYRLRQASLAAETPSHSTVMKRGM